RSEASSSMIDSTGGPARFADADRLAQTIIDRVGRHVVLALPLGLGKANHVANSLYARAVADRSIHLHIFTAPTLQKPRGSGELGRRCAAPFAERLFGRYPELSYALDQRAGRLPPNVEINEFFFQAGTRLAVPEAQQSYICANYTHVLRYLLDRG